MKKGSVDIILPCGTRNVPLHLGGKQEAKMRKDSTVGECCDGSLSHPLTTPIVSCNG